ARTTPPRSVINSRRLMGLTPKAKDHGTKYSSVLERNRAVRRSKTPRSCPDRDIAVGLSSAMRDIRAPFAPRLRWSLRALDLGAVHDAARIRIERVASVHGAAIIPHDEITDTPGVLPCKFRSINETPKLIE